MARRTDTDLRAATAEGAEAMREAAAKVAEWAHMVPPDGGSPTEAECAVAETAAEHIRALPIPGTDALAAKIAEAVTREREACAKIATSHKRAGANLCPYGRDKPSDPTWHHTDKDICPVCRKSGEDSLTHCTDGVGGEIAAAIRARATEAPDA